LLYVRAFVAFGFLTEVFLVLFTVLDTEERVPVTFLLLLILGVTLFVLELDRFEVALSFLLALVLFVDATLVFERVVLASSVVRLLDRAELASAFLLVLILLATLFLFKRAVLVLVISLLLSSTVLLTLRSLLFLGVCAYRLLFLVVLLRLPTCVLPRLP
jgi:hypothetical protein